MRKDKLFILAWAIALEIAGIVIIARATTSNSSPAAGIIFLVVGMVFVIIGITKKGETAKKDKP